MICKHFLCKKFVHEIVNMTTFTDLVQEVNDKFKLVTCHVTKSINIRYPLLLNVTKFLVITWHPRLTRKLINKA